MGRFGGFDRLDFSQTYLYPDSGKVNSLQFCFLLTKKGIIPAPNPGGWGEDEKGGDKSVT